MRPILRAGTCVLVLSWISGCGSSSSGGDNPSTQGAGGEAGSGGSVGTGGGAGATSAGGAGGASKGGSGGSGVGGTSNGGSSNGGSSAGGSHSGGSGGTSAGGASTGGMSTGGMSAGGASTGGTTSMGGTSGAGGTGGSSGNPWTVIPMVDGARADGSPIPFSGEGDVNGLYFDAPDHGVLTVNNFGTVGAIFAIEGGVVNPKALYTGDGKASGPQDIELLGLDKTQFGLVARSGFRNHLLASVDGGKSFTDVPAGIFEGDAGDPPGGQVFFRKDSGGVWTMIDGIGNVWKAAKDPGKTTPWVRTWQPAASPPVPDPLPADACQDSLTLGYYSASDPGGTAFATVDGQRVIYSYSDGNGGVGVCVSTDGGKLFKPRLFANVPDNGGIPGSPYTLTFTSDTNGFAARGNDLETGAEYVYVTTDAGETWAPGKLPASITDATKKIYFAASFADPTGKHVYLTGTNLSGDGTPVLLHSTDGGANWEDIGAALPLTGISGVGSKIHAGFALDDKHIWLGGEAGSLVFTSTGGN